MAGILAILLIIQTVVRVAYYNNVVKPWIQKAYKDGNRENMSQDNIVYFGENEYSADVFFKKWPSISGNWGVGSIPDKYFNLDTGEEGYLKDVEVFVNVFYCINEPIVMQMRIEDFPGGSNEYTSYELEFDENAVLISTDEESLEVFEKYKEDIKEALDAVKYFFDIPRDR